MPTTDSAFHIPAARGDIDVIDSTIINLLQLRAKISRDIQCRRLEAGGQRVAPNRESVILDRYGDAFGEYGIRIAETILEFCRN